MLPGFRFLVAAVVLCLSLVVFGFGATALLRSAREEFASLPVRRAAPQAAYVSPQADAPPTLSMLRVEPPEIRGAAPVDIAVIPQDSPAPTGAPEPERLASLRLDTRPAEIAAAEQALPEPAPVVTVAAEAPAVPVVVSPMPIVTEPSADEPIIVAAIVPATLPDQPASTLTEEDQQIAMLNVATLGGPAVDIEPAPLPKAKPVVTVKKKARVKVVKEKPAKRRRVAARADTQTAAAAQAPSPAPADTFGWQQPR